MKSSHWLESDGMKQFSSLKRSIRLRMWAPIVLKATDCTSETLMRDKIPHATRLSP